MLNAIQGRATSVSAMLRVSRDVYISYAFSEQLHTAVEDYV